MIEELKEITSLLKAGHPLSPEQLKLLTYFLESTLEGLFKPDPFKRLEEMLQARITELQEKNYTPATRLDERRNGKVLAFKSIKDFLNS